MIDVNNSKFSTENLSLKGGQPGLLQKEQATPGPVACRAIIAP